jgi:hypothetical protein
MDPDDDSRLSTIKPADGPRRNCLCLLGFSALRLADNIRPAEKRPTDVRPNGSPETLKLTGAMLFVFVLDTAGYLIAVRNVSRKEPGLIAALEDVFVVLELLTSSVGLILPGHNRAIGGRTFQGSGALSQRDARGFLPRDTRTGSGRPRSRQGPLCLWARDRPFVRRRGHCAQFQQASGGDWPLLGGS